MLEPLSVSQLLQQWRDQLVRVGLPGGTDTAPADAVEIAALEQQIGRGLPPTYRDFLAVCGGWPVTGALTAGLRPPARVGWFRDLESDWHRIWRDCAVDPDDPGPDVELMARALLVSEPGDQALLLDPDDVDPATGEWACYTLSNFAGGTHRVGHSFRAGLEYVYENFLASHPGVSATGAEADQLVERAYLAMLDGDLTARADLDALLRVSWRAWLLAAQFDAFGARPHSGADFSTAVPQLWSGSLSGVTAEEALADRVLMHELVPLYVVRLVESGRTVEIGAAPPLVAERMTAVLAEIENGTGPVADFSYSPVFAGPMEQARRQLAGGDPNAAWEVVQSALATWTPMSRNHLAPIGLYWDKDLRRLLAAAHHPVGRNIRGQMQVGPHQVMYTTVAARTDPPRSSRESVVAIPGGSRYSDRTVAILRHRYPTLL